MIMEALDTDHPIDCPICEANGDCRLQDYGYEYGVTGTDTSRPRLSALPSAFPPLSTLTATAVWSAGVACANATKL